MSHDYGLYDLDFYAWTQETTRLLKEGRVGEIDIHHIAEEIESIGNSERRTIVRLLSDLMMYLLRWRYQPVLRGNSWKNTIEASRIEIIDFFKDSPSLKNEVKTKFEVAYKKAIRIASNETGIEVKDFPKECPFSLADCLNENFWPD